jgi:hypothetical protein
MRLSVRFNGNGPIVGIDIDGTLGDYHSHFIRFAEMYTGKELPDPKDINPAQPFRQFLGLGKQTYRACKLAYRQGGMKRSMPCYAGARELTVSLRRSGAEVWICTSRPFNQLGNVDADTRHWLKRNGIQYDNVLWGENKYRDLRKTVGSRVIAIIDDLPEMIEQARSLDIYSLLRDQPYNKHLGPEYPRIRNLSEAQETLDILLKDLNRHLGQGFSHFRVGRMGYGR